MSATGRYVFAISAQDEASGPIGTINNALLGIGSQLSSLGGGFSTLGNVISGFATGGPLGAAVASVGELVNGLKSCVEEAVKSEDVWNRLKVTVENSGIAWTTVGDTIKKFAENAASMSRYTDEQVATAIKTLMDYGMNLDTAMKNVAATMDLATTKQIPLAEAATAVGKAFSGQEGILTRMGVVIADTVPKAERFGEAMRQVSEKFGGAAQADLDTYAGKWTQFQNKMTELMEKVGGALLPFLTSVADALIAVIDKVQWFVDMMTGILTGFQKWLVGGSFVQDTMNMVLDVVTGMGTKIVEAFANIWNSITDAATNALKTLSDIVMDGIRAIQDAFGGLYKALVGGSIWTDMWRDMVSQTKSGFDQILSETRRNVGNFEGMFQETAIGLTASGLSSPIPAGVGSSAPAPQTISVTIPITIQNMTGEVKDLENLSRMISRELGGAVKWRR